MKFNYKMLFIIVMLLFSWKVLAQISPSLPSGSKVYNLRVTVYHPPLPHSSTVTDTFTRSFGFDDGTEAFDLFEDSFLQRYFPGEGLFTGYMDTSFVYASINYQGVPAHLRYPASNSLLSLEFPLLNLKVFCFQASNSAGSFSGCTETEPSTAAELQRITGISGITLPDILSGGSARDESQGDLVDFLRNSDLADRLSKELAATSPLSSVAGNPNSVQSQLVNGGFNAVSGSGENGDASGTGDGDASGTGVASGALFAPGVQFGRYRQGGRDVTAHNLPLSYTYEWADGRKINIALPLSYVLTESAKTYKAGLEFYYTHPVAERWKLTPGIGYGVIGSKDLLTGAQMVSFSLGSLYELDRSVVGGEDWSLSIANMAGYYQSLPISVGKIDVDPDLTNQVIKNGLIVNIKKDFLKTPMQIQGYLTDTRFFGDALYSERYNEVGIYVFPQKRKGIRKYIGLNATYLFGERDINGIIFSGSYRF